MRMSKPRLVVLSWTVSKNQDLSFLTQRGSAAPEVLRKVPLC